MTSRARVTIFSSESLRNFTNGSNKIVKTNEVNKVNGNIPDLDFFLPLEVEAAEKSSVDVEAAVLTCCLARTETALRKSGELVVIPGTRA